MIRRDRIVELESRYIPLFKNEEKRLRSKNNLKNCYHYNSVSFYSKKMDRENEELKKKCLNILFQI